MTQTITNQQTTPLNGIDLGGFEEKAQEMMARPELAPAAFRVRSKWTGGVRVENRVDGYTLGGQEIARSHVIHSDEPLELLGGNTAPNPQDLILSAVASCLAVGYAIGATQRGIRLDQLEIDISGVLDLRGAFGLDPALPPGFPEVACTVRIAGDATEEQLRELHEEALQTSPNYFHLTSAIRMQPELVIA